MCVNPFAPPPLSTSPTFWAWIAGMVSHKVINTKRIFLITRIKQLVFLSIKCSNICNTFQFIDILQAVLK